MHVEIKFLQNICSIPLCIILQGKNSYKVFISLGILLLLSAVLYAQTGIKLTDQIDDVILFKLCVKNFESVHCHLLRTVLMREVLVIVVHVKL